MNDGELVDDRFRIEQRVGAGGMGVVYRARDEETGAIVALKVIHANTAEEIVRATREIETLAQFDHPSIVRHIKDGLTSTDQLYLAMGWIEGITLADRLETDGFSLREAAELVHAVALGLAAAHSASVLHRDIKPTNIMLEHGEPARAKLIDFGLARVVGTQTKAVTRTGITVGTPGYMSPEQARGVRQLSAASDVFNLGLILYEAATGRPAFFGSNLASLLLNIVLADPVPLSVYCPEAPPELTALVKRWLAKDPRQRASRRRRGGRRARAARAHGAAAGSPARRDSHRTIDGQTMKTPEPPAPRPRAHCLVLAARGFLDDFLDPPSAEELAVLERAADAADAQLEVLATGTVAAHLEGTPHEAALRAAELALAIRATLARWTPRDLDHAPRPQRRLRRGHRAARPRGEGGAVRAREAPRGDHDRPAHRVVDRGRVRDHAQLAAAGSSGAASRPARPIWQGARDRASASTGGSSASDGVMKIAASPR